MSENKGTQEAYSLKEAAEKLRVSPSYIRAQLRNGNVRSTRLGRLHRFSSAEIARITQDGLPTLGPYQKKSRKATKEK